MCMLIKYCSFACIHQHSLKLIKLLGLVESNLNVAVVLYIIDNKESILNIYILIII